jgi:alpha-1,2-mannosyltransferase
MRGLLLTLQTGDWLTRERVRLWALMVMLASVAGVIFLLITSNGLDDFQGKPLGTDFSNIYAGGTYVLDGKPEMPFDPALQHAREKEIFGAHTPFLGWCYPPFLLFVAAALALMPYLAALFVWQATTFPLYLLAIWAILSSSLPEQRGGDPKPTPSNDLVRSRLWLLVAASFPAVFINLGHGHNGFLTAALMGFALLLLDRRPIVAAVWPAGLQAAIRVADPSGADRHRPLEGFRCCRSHGRRARACRHARFWAGSLARLFRLHRFHPRGRARGRRHRLA